MPEAPIEGTSKLKVIAGKNDSVCTYTFLKTHFVEQEFFRCRTCFTGENLGCCAPCARKCHATHSTVSIGMANAFCDCGLQSCAIYCKAGRKCNYDAHGQSSRIQMWFQCRTCWGEDSVFGCCEECAKGCHLGHDLVSQELRPSLCDCGRNGHKSNICTFYLTGKKFHKQPFYFCHTCFTSPNEGCCFQCMKNCHSNHKVTFKGTIKSFCDCGTITCAIKCKIPKPE